MEEIFDLFPKKKGTQIKYPQAKKLGIQGQNVTLSPR